MVKKQSLLKNMFKKKCRYVRIYVHGYVSECTFVYVLEFPYESHVLVTVRKYMHGPTRPGSTNLFVGFGRLTANPKNYTWHFFKGIKWSTETYIFGEQEK